MNNVLVSIFLLLTISLSAQKVSDYAYVIVPEKYNVMKSADQHQINSLTKFLLNKYGYEAYLVTDERPFNLENAACKVLYADLEDDSNFIQTRLNFLLKDCKGNVIYKTTQGRSKKKEYVPAYHEALREAFEDIRDLKYSYSGKQKIVVKVPLKDEYKMEEEVAKEVQKEIPLNDNLTNDSADIIVSDSADTVAKNQTQPVVFTSEDDYYKAVQYGNSVIFYEGDEVIGSSSLSTDDTFLVETSKFNGNAYYKEERLIIERKIKGIAGTVEMIFTKQE